MMNSMFKTLLSQITADKSEVRVKPAGVRAKDPVFRFALNTLNGKETISLERYRGRKILLINLASRCGYTPQYADWQQFHETCGDRIIVLGFPANNFLWQEPGNAAQIEQFCQLNYGVTFPLFEKINVVGNSQHPLYQWLSRPEHNGWNDQAPTWNFCKYLLDEEGELTHFFGPNIKPGHPAFEKAIAGVLSPF